MARITEVRIFVRYGDKTFKKRSDRMRALRYEEFLRGYTGELGSCEVIKEWVIN